MNIDMSTYMNEYTNLKFMQRKGSLNERKRFVR